MAERISRAEAVLDAIAVALLGPNKTYQRFQLAGEVATLRARLAEAREAAGEIKELAIEQEPVSIGNQWAWRKVEFLTRSITAPHPTEKEKL